MTSRGDGAVGWQGRNAASRGGGAAGRRRVLGASLLVAFALAAGCQRGGAAGGEASAGAERLVTVGGAVTETVFALGAGERVVGVDTSSIYPELVKKLPQLGYQRTLAAEGVIALRPTLVIASAEAGPPAALAQIRAAGVRLEVVPSEHSAEGAKNKVRAVARLLGREAAAEPIAAAIDRDVRAAGELIAAAPHRPKVLPVLVRGGQGAFVSGRGSAADAMVRLAGGENAAAAIEGSKLLTAEAAVAAAPDLVLAPAAALAGAGGVAGLLALPGVAETPAGRARRVIVLDDLLLLGFGPRTGEAALELARKLRDNPGGGAP